MARSVVADGSTRTETVSEKVVSEVADVIDADPRSLEPLYNAIDPDALDALFETSQWDSRRSTNRVTFAYCGCDVVVTGDETVYVSKSNEERSK